MLLYAIYTPKNPSSWDRESVFAFASVEQYVYALNKINGKKKTAGKMTPITKDGVLSLNISIVALFVDISPDGMPNGGVLVNVQEGAVKNKWDGKWIPLTLVERKADEYIPGQMDYP